MNNRQIIMKDRIGCCVRFNLSRTVVFFGIGIG